VVRSLLSYGARDFVSSVRQLGVRPGDTLLVHSAFGGHHGFREGIHPFIEALIEAVGPDGNLLMMSLPYLDAALDYLQETRRFDVRRTPSMTGLVTEYFRRRPDVIRSLNPMHPVLARGKLATWFTDGHDRCVHSCGPGSPFEKLVEVDGKVLFFNTRFTSFTFFHHLEHLVREEQPFSLYANPPFEIEVIDGQGERRMVQVCAFSREAIRRRRYHRFESQMRARALIKRTRIGATTLELVSVRDAVRCVEEMRLNGVSFYDRTSSEATT
jgi:aminoglycoside 3-N-acetyltransferase